MTDVQELTYVDPETGEYQSRGPALHNIQDLLVVARIDVNAVSDDWETLVSLGIEILKAHDSDRFVLGDIALHRIVPRYGEAAVETYADEIGCARSTMYQYLHVSKFFEESIRPDCFRDFEELTWSHYFQAARVDRAGDLDRRDDEDLWEQVHEQDLCVSISFLVSSKLWRWAARSKLRKAVNAFLHTKAQAETQGVYKGNAEEIVGQITKAMVEGELPAGPLKAVVSYVPVPPPDVIDPLPEGMKPVFTWAEPEDIERVKRLSAGGALL